MNHPGQLDNKTGIQSKVLLIVETIKPLVVWLPFLMAATLVHTSAAQVIETNTPKLLVAPTIVAARASGEIHIDGRLDDAAWKSASVGTKFSQSYPNPGAEPRQRTEVRVLYDNVALYIGVRAFDPHPDSIAAPLARRDASGIYSDWISVVIDPYHDRRTAYRFSVNPRGVQTDAIEFNDNNEDLNWDAVWQVATFVDSLGWTAEYRIPLSQLRFGPSKDGRDRVWGFQVQRDVARYNERDSWSPWTQQSPGYVSSFGDLTGLSDLPVPERVELIPYVSTKLTRAPGTSADPLYRRNDTKPSVGGDLNYGLPNGLTLTATVNPDFGQVEVDPAVVNLTAFETFFPEKRPFFLEGSDIFRFGQTQTDASYNSQIFFYSRRIGRAPELAVPGSDIAYVNAPNQSSILGAVKLAGKTHGWTIGLMDGVTGEETARYVTTSGAEGTSTVEPLTNYAVARVRHDFNDGNTALGGMITATNRNVADTVIGGALRSRAFLGGIDFDHSWDSRNWILSGYVTASQVDGTPAAITATQLSSAHYYQRPDAAYLGVHTTRTSLSGHMAEFALAKRGKWFGSLDYKEVSPGFEINDLGFIAQADYRAFVPALGYQSNEPGHIFRNYSITGASFDAWDFGGTLIRQSNVLTANGTFNNLWATGIQVTYGPDQLSNQLTRGGPLAMVPALWKVDASINSDSRKPAIVSGEIQYQHDAAGGFADGANITLDVRPNSVIHVRFGPTLSVNSSTNQYVRAIADPLATRTYGNRYIFANLHQTTLSLDTRLDWTFSTNLSLQLYAQPFVSAGTYTSFKQFLTPRTRQFGVYGDGYGTSSRNQEGVYTLDPDGTGPASSFQLGDPSFNVRSLQGDAVLRWEYRPGSTIFFVWQQQRNGVAPIGDFGFTRDVGAIFQEQPTNVFLVKATFWFSR
jgi:hypothetical protein